MVRSPPGVIGATPMEPFSPNDIVRGPVGVGPESGAGTGKFREDSTPTTREELGMTVFPNRSDGGFSIGGTGALATATALAGVLSFLK